MKVAVACETGAYKRNESGGRRPKKHKPDKKKEEKRRGGGAGVMGMASNGGIGKNSGPGTSPRRTRNSSATAGEDLDQQSDWWRLGGNYRWNDFGNDQRCTGS
jgi:hypothetical protein